jgi:hypothetical protein
MTLETAANMSHPNTSTRAQQALPSTSGSQTITQTPPEPAVRLAATSGTLRLRAEPAERRHIQWAEDVVDNEGMGKKSSKGRYPNPIYTVEGTQREANTFQSAAYITKRARWASPRTNRALTLRATTTAIASRTIARRGLSGEAEREGRGDGDRTGMIMSMERGMGVVVRGRRRGGRGGNRVRMRMRRCRSRRSRRWIAWTWIVAGLRFHESMSTRSSEKYGACQRTG